MSDGRVAPVVTKKPATIREVAKLAGVSLQTVSRYLREDKGMKPETKAAVAGAIEQLDYRPSHMARSMRSQRTKRIGVILPASAGFVPTRMLRGAASAAHEAGFLLDVVSLEGDAAARAARMKALLPRNVDGIVSFASLSRSMQGLQEDGLTVPVVVEGEYDDNMRAQGILADASPAAEIVRYLAGLGHRRFAHVAGAEQWASARNRRTVYERAIAAMGLQSMVVVDGDWTVKSGWDAASTIAESGATAVFAANDQVAFGVIRGMQSLGIEVPEQVSVFGWDDEELGRYFRPSLSTVSVDRERQGREAINRLIAQLNGTEPPARLSPESLNRLVIRRSTGPAVES